MKRILSFFLITLMIFSVSCSDNCDEGDQPTPASFFVEIIDEATGENVFSNETYTLQQITILDLNDIVVPYKFIEQLNIIQIFPNNNVASGNALVIKLNNETSMQTDEINVNYDVASRSGECFTTYKIENILFPNNQSELVEAVFEVKI
jgi:hypothetical protein